MPERPDLRKIASDIREALETYPREALVDVLTYVFQAYVVEGAPVVHAPQAERVPELEGLAFHELIQALQVRLEVPELALFEVASGRVSVRLGGELHPILMGADQRRAVQAPLPTAAAPAPPAPAAPAATPAAPARPAEAPRPTRGISVNPSPSARPAAPAGPVPAQGTRPAAQTAAPSEEAGDDDAASKRFKLLEID